MASSTTAASPPTGTQSTGTDSARDTVQDVAGQAKEAAGEVAGQAREQAQDAKAKATSRVRDEIDGRTTAVGTQVHGAAGDLRELGERMRGTDREPLASLAEQGADGAERLGGYLKEADADRLLRDVESAARRNPGAVIAGGLLLGFAASRVLRASSAGRIEGASSPAARRELPSPSGTGTPAARPATPQAPPVAPHSTAGDPDVGPGVGAGNVTPAVTASTLGAEPSP